MDIVESLLTRADWHAKHHVSGPSYCYTIGDQNVDRKAADEIGRLRAALAEIRARAPTMNNGGAWAGGLAALCLMSKNEQAVDRKP